MCTQAELQRDTPPLFLKHQQTSVLDGPNALGAMHIPHDRDHTGVPPPIVQYKSKLVHPSKHTVPQDCSWQNKAAPLWGNVGLGLGLKLQQ